MAGPTATIPAGQAEASAETRPDLTEAIAIVEALASIRERLHLADRKFLTSWETYLARTGSQAAIGRWRLANLRRVASVYELQVEERVRIDVAEFARLDI